MFVCSPEWSRNFCYIESARLWCCESHGNGAFYCDDLSFMIPTATYNFSLLLPFMFFLLPPCSAFNLSLLRTSLLGSFFITPLLHCLKMHFVQLRSIPLCSFSCRCITPFVKWPRSRAWRFMFSFEWIRGGLWNGQWLWGWNHGWSVYVDTGWELGHWIHRWRLWCDWRWWRSLS